MISCDMILQQGLKDDKKTNRNGFASAWGGILPSLSFPGAGLL